MLCISTKEESRTATEEDKEEISKSAKVFDILFTVFVYLLAAGIVVSAILYSFDASPTKSVFGYRYYTVLTGSMAPTYNIGDTIFVQLKNPEDINEGDVITFNPSLDSEAYLTHRVVEKIENYEGTGVICFRTKGDANSSQDIFLIEGQRVIGTVNFGIPFLGYVIRFFQLRWYFIIPIVIMIAVFLYLLKRYFQMGQEEDEDDDNDDNNISGEKEKTVSSDELVTEAKSEQT